MYSSVNTIWVLLGAALVFLMQAGFAMCEAGFTRAKNTGNILMKNLMDFCIGTPVYWLLGFGLMFASGGALIGGLDPMVQGDYSAILPEGVPLFAYLIFQTVFCATSATIVSGAMAERTKFLSYCIYSFCISAFIYPISATGSGAAAGSVIWASTPLPAPRRSTWWVASVPVSAPPSSAPDWANTTRTANPGPSWATASLSVPSVCSSCGSAGLGSMGPLPSP